MSSLEQIEAEHRHSVWAKLKRFATGNFWIKAMMLMATAFATAMQFFTTGPWVSANYFGFTACLFIVACGIYILWIEADSSVELARAERAITLAQDLDGQFTSLLDEMSDFEDARLRVIELFNATQAMREALDISIEGSLDVLSIVASLLKVSARSLCIASGFRLDRHYTICVYEARPADTGSRHKTNLHCVAHHRSVDCSLANARIWPSGVGVAGYSFANAMETIVADLRTDTRSWSNSIPKKDDDKLYRSVAAIPILVGLKKEPWGVVVGTSDVENQFDEDEPGVQSADALRALANYVSLTIMAVRPNVAPIVSQPAG